VLDRPKTYFTKGKVFYGLEIYQSGEGRIFQLVEIAQKKGELIITDSQLMNEMSQVAAHVKNAYPIHIVLHTDDVITKHTRPDSMMKGTAPIEHLFPGLDLDSFYYEIFQVKNTYVVSICKQQIVSSILKTCKEFQLNPVGVSLGTSPLAHVLDFLEEPVVKINTEKVNLGHSEEQDISMVKTDGIPKILYNLNGLQIPGQDLLGFAGVLGFLTNSPKITSNFHQLVGDLKKDFGDKRTFSLLLRIFIGLTLGVLLINFFIFNHYYGKTEQLRTSLALDSENKKNLILMRDRAAEKEKKVDAIVSVSNSRASFYLDRFAATVPESILLTEIQYQPLERPMQPSKPIELEEGTLLALGSSANSADFSLWITTLESLEWIAKVETMDYDYKNNNSSEFKIQISVSAPKK